MLGTLINVAAVLLGSAVGLLFHARLPKRITHTVFQAIGLFTVFVGINMAGKTGNFLVLILSMVLGAIIGEALDIEARINRLGDRLKSRSAAGGNPVSEGFITASLLFCVGSMSILGAIEEGLGGKPNLLLAKAVLDGFSSIALSAGLGIGVLFSAVTVLVYQGGLALFAGALEPVITEAIISEVTAVGGLLLMGVGISILEIKAVRVVNMLPALLVAVALAAIFL